MEENKFNEVLLRNYKQLFNDAKEELYLALIVARSENVLHTIELKIKVIKEALKLVSEVEDNNNFEEKNIPVRLKNYYNIATRCLVEYRYETNLDFLIDLNND